jgi:hypothetical protein
MTGRGSATRKLGTTVGAAWSVKLAQKWAKKVNREKNRMVPWVEIGNRELA